MLLMYRQSYMKMLQEGIKEKLIIYVAGLLFLLKLSGLNNESEHIIHNLKIQMQIYIKGQS